MTPLRPDRTELAPGLGISRVVTGLWQVADMERDGPRSIRKLPAMILPAMSPPVSTRSTWPITMAAPS